MSPRKKLLYGSLGVGGAGLGARLLGNELLPGNVFNDFYTQEGKDLLSGTHAGNNPTYDNAFKAYADYAGNSHKLMQESVLGLPVKSVIKTLRNSPLSDEKWKGLSSDLHYDAFKEGPFNGFIRYVDEQWHPDNVNNNPTLMERWEMGYNPMSIRTELKDIANKYLEENAGVKNYYNGISTGGVPVNETPLSVEEQARLLPGFKDYFNSHASRALKKQFIEASNAPYRSYHKYSDKVMHPYEDAVGGLKTIGNVLMGAGLGGGAGTLLANYLTKNEKNKNRNMIIGGTLGAGLGGLASYGLTNA